jgi:hypothetical protein
MQRVAGSQGLGTEPVSSCCRSHEVELEEELEEDEQPLLASPPPEASDPWPSSSMAAPGALEYSELLQQHRSLQQEHAKLRIRLLLAEADCLELRQPGITGGGSSSSGSGGGGVAGSSHGRGSLCGSRGGGCSGREAPLGHLDPEGHRAEPTTSRTSAALASSRLAVQQSRASRRMHEQRLLEYGDEEGLREAAERLEQLFLEHKESSQHSSSTAPALEGGDEGAAMLSERESLKAEVAACRAELHTLAAELEAERRERQQLQGRMRCMVMMGHCKKGR